MADELNKKQRQECLETFHIFDQDRDGIVTTGELGKMLKAMGFIPTVDELEELVSEADPQGDGSLDIKGFMRLFQMFYNDMKTEDQVKSSFRVYDKNGDGYITHSELKFVLQGIGERVSDEEVEDIISRVDKDDDGKINFKEFRALLEK
ncbi:calmodulin-alpha-like [Pecten maximus]|uniref:calmodulin-alpha-like n=1 Tax=Pecten maximus TaxID=6579 RepID=UPI0014584452|nr:calmodulin-alpha-like [Pecten maximus]